MADKFQVKALYDFDAQPGTGELSIAIDEILTVTRQDVGEGWWEGVNSRGEKGLFPAGYVEVVDSLPPPSIPPPPPPPADNFQFTPYNQQQQQQQESPDDWEDDWNDDDSNYSQEQAASQGQAFNVPVGGPKDAKPGETSSKGFETRGSVKKSFNRFSTFVKSGGEAFILGQTKMTVPSDQCVTIIDDGGEVMWAPNPAPFTCSVASPKKATKMRGLKSFIEYKLTPSFNNIVVCRRYKHFDWLHGIMEEKFSSIPIPPLPDKQISGRYQDEFIEHRMNQLQMWVNRISRHPVLSQCDVWKHFMTCTDERLWKAGKRNAEKDKLVGGNFFHAICTPPTPLDHIFVEKQMEMFSRFVVKMDDSVSKLGTAATSQQKIYCGAFKKELLRMSEALKDLGISFEMDTSLNSQALTTAIKHTGETYEKIGKIYEDQPKYDVEPMSDVLHEYKGMLSSWPDVLNILKSALVKTSEHKKLRDEGKLSSNDVASISHRTDVICYATMAEVNHFQQERVAYFKSMMETYLTAQIDFYQRITQELQTTLAMYQNS